MTQVRHREAVVAGQVATYRIDLPGRIGAAVLVRRMDQLVADEPLDTASRSSRTVVSMADGVSTLVCDQRFVVYRGRMRTVSCVVSEYCGDQLVRKGGVGVFGLWAAGRPNALGLGLLGVLHGFALADEFDARHPAEVAGPRVDLMQHMPSAVSVRPPMRRVVGGVIRDVVPIEVRRSENLDQRWRIRARRPHAVLYVDPVAELPRVGSRVVAASFTIRGVGDGSKGYLELDDCADVQ